MFDENKTRHAAAGKMTAAHRRYQANPTDQRHEEVRQAHHLYDHRLVRLDEADGSTEENPRGRADCACGWAAEANGPDHEDAIASVADQHAEHVAATAPLSLYSVRRKDAGMADAWHDRGPVDAWVADHPEYEVIKIVAAT